MIVKMTFKENSLEYSEMCRQFDCGNSYINNFLKENSFNNEIAKTFILINEEVPCIMGFFSLSADSLIEKSNDQKTIELGPAIRIYMFAVDKRYQGYHYHLSETIASFLLNQCIEVIKKVVEHYIGATFIVLSSTKEGYHFYKKKGDFEELEQDMAMLDILGDNDTIKMYRDIFEDEY